MDFPIFLKIFRFVNEIFENFGMKNMKLAKTSKNDGLPQDFFRRAKRAGKIAVLGLAEKKTLPSSEVNIRTNP